MIRQEHHLGKTSAGREGRREVITYEVGSGCCCCVVVLVVVAAAILVRCVGGKKEGKDRCQEE